MIYLRLLCLFCFFFLFLLNSCNTGRNDENVAPTVKPEKTSIVDTEENTGLKE